MNTTVNNGYAPVREVSQEELRDYEMPVPQVGQAVLWYKRGLKTDRGGMIVHVQKVNARSVDLSNGYRNALHVGDPRLMMNEHQRENGSWEFTPFDLQREAKLAQLEKLVQEATKQLNQRSK